MIITADLHIKEDTEASVFGEVLPGLHKAALAQKPPRILAILGDIYHMRYRIPVFLQNRFYFFLLDCVHSGVEVILIPGNHDQVNPMGENAIEVLSHIPKVTVYSQPTEDKHGLWIPHRKNVESVLKALKARPKPGPVFMHQGVNGAMQNVGIKDTGNLFLESFEKETVIFSGHYHAPQTLNNLIYVGSPYQVKADEAGQTKGYVEYDGKSFDFVDTVWGKRYFKYAMRDTKTLVPEGARPEDELRIEVDGSNEIALAATKALDEQGFHNVIITVKPIATKQRLEMEEGASTDDYAQAYVDNHETELDKVRLMHVYRNLTGA